MLINLDGHRIFITHDWPKMQLSADCPVTPEFRVEMNTWMLGFFGVDNLLKDNEVIFADDSIHMNPRTYEKFKLAMAKKGKT